MKGTCASFLHILSRSASSQRGQWGFQRKREMLKVTGRDDTNQSAEEQASEKVFKNTFSLGLSLCPKIHTHNMSL
uniref:Uncharacterized protein n=1 Tax=Anguilla anguilla TaxID=7936 RepID=A0A0E9UW86_ANGAN